MPYSFGLYEDSMLQKTLFSLLSIINEIKIRFPILEKEETLESIKTYHLLKAIESGTLFLNRSFLPLFSQGRSLNSLDMIPLMWTIPSLRAQFKDLTSIKDPKQLFLRSLGRYLMTKQFEMLNASLSLINANVINQDDMQKQVAMLVHELRQQMDSLFSFDKAMSQEKRIELFESSIEFITHVLKLDRNLLKHKNPISIVLENLTLELFPKHQAFYFFIERLTLLMSDIPRDLKLLVPFFNPESIPKSIHGTILGSMLPLGGRSWCLSDEEQFSYHIKNGEVVEKEINFSKLYRKSYDELFSHLRSVRRRYLARAIDDLSLKDDEITINLTLLDASEQAKKQLLLSFVAQEKNAMSVCFRPLDMVEPHDKSDTQSILDEIKSLGRSRLYLIELIEKLRSLKQSYIKTTVFVLFKKYSELFEQCQRDAEKGLNVDYLAEVLPEEISDGTEGPLAMRGENLKINQALQAHVLDLTRNALHEIEKIDSRIKLFQSVILHQFRLKNTEQRYQNISSNITLKPSGNEDRINEMTEDGLFQSLEDIGMRLFLQTTKKNRQSNKSETQYSVVSHTFFSATILKQQRENIELLDHFDLKGISVYPI